MVEIRKSEFKNNITIIIPTFNSASTLKKCLQSIHDNIHYNSVVIVDSNSSDSTLKLAENYGATILSLSGYPSSKRNFGVLNSDNQFILFIDSDEVLRKGTIDECVYIIEKEDADFVCFEFFFVGNGFFGSCSALLRNILGFQLKKINELHPIPRFFKREAFISVGLYNENLILGEDWELYQRLRDSDLKKASSQPMIYHVEQSSLKKMISKEFRYGQSTKRLRQQKINPWSRYGLLLTIKEILLNSDVSPQIKIGSLFLLIFRSSARLTGKIFSKVLE